jgi:hypothetical protein
LRRGGALAAHLPAHIVIESLAAIMALPGAIMALEPAIITVESGPVVTTTGSSAGGSAGFLGRTLSISACSTDDVPASDSCASTPVSSPSAMAASEATPAKVSAMPSSSGRPLFRNGWSPRANTNGSTGRMQGLRMVSTPPR